MTPVQRDLALQVFRAGFIAGALSVHTGREVAVPDDIPLTIKHWRRGFDAGRAAMDAEETAYRKELAN